MALRLILVLSLTVTPLWLAKQSMAQEPVRPYEEVRALARVQDGLAQGKNGSVALQRALVSRISKQFLRASPNLWSDRRNAIAAIRYLISGGDPTFAEQDAVAAQFPEPLRALFEASSAYASGRLEEARVRFARINPRDVDALLAGHVALIKSLVISAKDPHGSMRLLDDARLLGVGTLVEEAALRRQVAVLAQQEPRPLFLQLTARYVRRFQRSMFASAFRQHLASGLTHSAFTLDDTNKAWLNNLLDTMDASQRPTYAMVIAERAVVLGRAKLVELVTVRIQGDAGLSSDFAARAHLYNAAVAITGKDHEGAFAVLTKPTTAFRPSSFEERLRMAAIAVADGIAGPVEVDVFQLDRPIVGKAFSPVTNYNRGAFASTLSAARAAIREVDRYLTGPQPDAPAD